jgi:alpha-beta hydrolase superfamily lysophospholipase
MSNWILFGLLSLVLLYALVCVFYYVFQERLIFAPRWPVIAAGEILISSEYESFFVDTPNEGRIHSLLIRSNRVDPRGCILYFHGNTGNIQRWAPIAEELCSYGFDIMLPDYRTYGQSTGKLTEENLYSDALELYKLAKSKYSEDKICVYGRSLGSAMASRVAARTNPGAVILETPFNNLIEVASHLSRIIPVKFFLKFNFRNDIHLKQLSSPILIFHGTKDKLVPYKLGLKLYESIKDKPDTHMLTIPGGKHNNLNGYPILRARLSEFFDKYFGI